MSSLQHSAQSADKRLAQRIRTEKQNKEKNVAAINPAESLMADEVFEMVESPRSTQQPPVAESISESAIVSIPQAQPRRSILHSKNGVKSGGGAVNLSFQADEDDDKRDKLSVGNEFAENLKDSGQEIAPDAKDQHSSRDGHSDVPPLSLPVGTAGENNRPLTVRADDGHVLGVTIHQTDPLEMDYHIRHPMVRIHMIDQKIGNYLAKLDRNRPVSSFYETQHSRSDYILPILTQPFSFSQHRSLIPRWEETVVFNENFYYFSDPNVSTYIIFELLDYVSPAEISDNIRTSGREAGWIKIAWAFLKVVGKGGQLNTGRRCRLQLYRLPRQRVPSSSLCEAASWLNATTPRIKYPSTLYVNVKALQLPSQLLPTSRSMIATQGEIGMHTTDNFAKTLGLLSSVTGQPMLKSSTQAANQPSGMPGGKDSDILNWSRLPGQVCRLPNYQLSSLYVGQMGCNRLAFSTAGLHIAAAGVDPPSCDYPIIVYGVKTLTVACSLYGHMNVVYDLNWSPDDSKLISASSDATARIWQVGLALKSDANSEVEHVTLAHPSFVYAARFHPKVGSLAVTGCQDGKIRIFGLGIPVSTGKLAGFLLQELEPHAGLINALEFDPAGHELFSGSSLGQLHVWLCHVTAQPNHPQCGFTKPWQLFKRVKAKEIDGIVINRLIRPKQSTRILVHTRDSTLRMYDLASEACTQLYTGHVNARDFIGCCVTPCGTFVLAASEVGTCFVWNAITGDIVTVYDKLKFSSGVSDVQFHPYEHMVGFCSYGDSQPVYLYGFDENRARLEAEYLKRVERGETLSGEQKLNLFEPDRVDMDKEIESINEQLARNFEKRALKVNKALNAVAGLPQSTFKQNVVDSLLFGGAQPNQQAQPNAVMLTSTHFSQQPVINFNISADGEKVETDIKAPPQTLLPTTKKPQKYLVLYDYEPQRADELALRKGDFVVLLCRESERWWLGENLTSGSERGYFPANYVTPTDEQQRRKVFRTRKFNTSNAVQSEAETRPGTAQSQPLSLFQLEPPKTARSAVSQNAQ